MKIPPVEAELFHAERWTEVQTDTTQPILAFRNLQTLLKMRGIFGTVSY